MCVCGFGRTDMHVKVTTGHLFPGRNGSAVFAREGRRLRPVWSGARRH